jgi:hypothetical protein
MGSPGLSLGCWAGGSGPTRWQRLVLGLLYIGGRWGFARIRRYALVAGWGERPEGDARRRAARVLNAAENVFKLVWLLNFLLFLQRGQYPSLLERVARMKLVYRTGLVSPHPRLDGPKCTHGHAR